jgi:hypothetical protein
MGARVARVKGFPIVLFSRMYCGLLCDVPMSFADAWIVRMTETMNDPVLLTTDADFRIYRRHGRQTIPCVSPP